MLHKKYNLSFVIYAVKSELYGNKKVNKFVKVTKLWI